MSCMYCRSLLRLRYFVNVSVYCIENPECFLAINHV